jgi:hypothetical protein
VKRGGKMCIGPDRGWWRPQTPVKHRSPRLKNRAAKLKRLDKRAERLAADVVAYHRGLRDLEDSLPRGYEPAEQTLCDVAPDREPGMVRESDGLSRTRLKQVAPAEAVGDVGPSTRERSGEGAERPTAPAEERIQPPGAGMRQID